MKENQDTITGWANATFGPAGSNARVAARANEEMAELLRALTVDDNHPKAAEEVADVVIILYRLASRLGVDLLEEVDRKMDVNRAREWKLDNTGHVRYIKADNEAGARSSGALANIAEGRGTAIDAAKFLRDADATVDDLARAGVSLKGKIASDAVALTRLSDKAFEGVSTGTLDETKAIAVAKYLTDHSLQDKLLKRMAAREEDGKEWTIKEIETASRKMANAGVLKTQGFDLFGEFESEESTFDQEVEIESFIRRQLAQEVSDFSAVASQRRADRVASAGNVLHVDQNELRAKSAEILLNSFDRESGLRGEVADTIKTYAAELAGVTSKSKKADVKTRSFEAIREMLLKGESRV